MIKDTFPMIIGEEKVRSERTLLAGVENGKYMTSADSVRFLVLHCSATRCNQDYSVEQLRRDHKARGFYDIGYHFYIRKDGTITQHRKLLEVGAHTRPYNRCSIGICYEGGLDEKGKPCNTMTAEQETRLVDLFRNLKILFPKAKIVGHRDLPGTTPKECPCLDAGSWAARHRKHPTPIAIQLHYQCLLGIQSILRNWTFLIFKQV